MSFQIIPLSADTFAHLDSQTPEALAAHGVIAMEADLTPGFPCRVSLEDAAVGERVYLLNFEHLDAASPYRANGAIFVRAGARTAKPAVDEIPPVLAHRQLSTRGYDKRGMMRDARTCEGGELPLVLRAMLANPAIEQVHIHNAKPGCYACRAVRA